MALYKFASLNFPNKYGYAYDSDAFSRSRESETNQYFRQFETLGDGLIQHSGDWSVTFEYLADFLESMAAAMVENEEMAMRLGSIFSPHAHRSRIEFAASVVWRESDNNYTKRRYFSMSQEKIGTRTKEHDKRYEEINRYLDGSCASILRLLCDNYTCGFARWCISEEVRDWATEQKKHPGFGERWPEYFGGDWNKVNALRGAFGLCRRISEATRLRASVVEDMERRRVMREENAAVAATAAVVAAADKLPEPSAV